MTEGSSPTGPSGASGAPQLKVVVAPDSFKESLPAQEVAEALAAGLGRVWPEAHIELLPLSDGGEGWVQNMVSAAGGSFVDVSVRGPIEEEVEARYGLIEGTEGVTTAVIEMATASGLGLVSEDRRDPRRATTYGTGELIRDAIDRGARRLLVGIGGSATNDGGAGMACALGARFTDASGKELSSGGVALADLESVDLSGLDGRLAEVEIIVASDVENPLLGDDGASAVYGPQKGADADAVRELDGALCRFADVVEDAVGREFRDRPGAGAAGGLGFGLMAFCGAELQPGVELVLDTLGADGVLDGAALALTAEGLLDSQTLSGKVPVGVARRAKRRGVPVVAVGGAVEAMGEATLRRFADEGVVAICSSVEGAGSECDLMDPDGTRQRLERAGERIARLVDLGRRL
ncbi:MAG: glycerate kinase [Actinomycetota bacterium]|nr:glycerate kinase [Actinomycetota bacterium]